MDVKQFYDTGLAHASYAIVSGDKMAVIDPLAILSLTMNMPRNMVPKLSLYLRLIPMLTL